MPSDLRPRKWPHFMEKFNKPKEQVYTSQKVLGQLYDQVERVDFVPDYDAPFDKRILAAYDVTEKLLSDAAEVKEQYDAAMYRIMAQHDIRTEFEVWSTFVMHHTNQSKDYKFHKEMGEISVALKDRFRSACYDKAGGKDFAQIGPFVAAMYTVTYREMVKAIAECRDMKIDDGVETFARQRSTKTMPLMSFPWLFQSHLGKIANGILRPSVTDNVDPSKSMRSGGPRKVVLKRSRAGLSPSDEDTLETAQGTIHRGELLELFSHEDDKIASKDENPSVLHQEDFQQDPPISLEQDAYASLDGFEKLSAFSVKPDPLDAPSIPKPEVKLVLEIETTATKPISSVGLLDLDVTREDAIHDQDTSPTSATDTNAFAVFEDSDTWPTLTPTRSRHLAVTQLEREIFDAYIVSNTLSTGGEPQSRRVIDGGLEDEENETNQVASRTPALEEGSNPVTLPSLSKVSPDPDRHFHSRVGSKTGLIFRVPETKPLMVVPKLGTLVDFGPDEINVRSSKDLTPAAKSGADSLFEPDGLESLSLVEEPSTISDQPIISQVERIVGLGAKTDASTVVGYDLGATGVGTLIGFDFDGDGRTSLGFSTKSTTQKPAPFDPEYDLLTGIDEPDLLSPVQELDLSSATTLGIEIEGGFEEQEDLIQGEAFLQHTFNRATDGEAMYGTRGPAIGQGADDGSEHSSENRNEVNSDGEDGEEEVTLPISVKPLPFERLEALLDS